LSCHDEQGRWRNITAAVRRQRTSQLGNLVGWFPFFPAPRPHGRVGRDRAAGKRSAKLFLSDEPLLARGICPAPFGLVAHVEGPGEVISRVCDWRRDGEDETIDPRAARLTQRIGTRFLRRPCRTYIVNEQDRALNACSRAERASHVAQACPAVELGLFVRWPCAFEQAWAKRCSERSSDGARQKRGLVEASFEQARWMKGDGRDVGCHDAESERLGREKVAQRPRELGDAPVLEARDRRRKRPTINERCVGIR